MSIKELIERRAQLNSDYVLALGTCVYIFSEAEWMAVGCCELLEPGYKRKASINNKGIMAWNTSETLINLAKKQPETEDREALIKAAENLKTLVSDERNSLLHAHPVAIDDTATLKNSTEKNGKVFDLDALQQYADEAAKCSSELNHAYHKYLKNL